MLTTTPAENRRAKKERAPWLRKDHRPGDEPQSRAMPVYRFDAARWAACQVMEIRYNDVDAPRSENQFAAATSPFESDHNPDVPRSWEIMTDSL